MTTHLRNPFSDLQPVLGSQTVAAPVSSPGHAAAVTNSAPEVMALTAPGMARRETWNRRHSMAEASGTARKAPSGPVIGPAHEEHSSRPAPLIPAHVAATLDVGIRRAVEEIAADRSPAFIAAPSAAYLTAISRNP